MKRRYKRRNIPRKRSCTGSSTNKSRKKIGPMKSLLPPAQQQPLTILLNHGQFAIRSNAFGFSFAGAPDQAVTVEFSPDLSNWTPLTTNILGTVPAHFSDPLGGLTRGFYRLRAP
jgi:hypothetical protein